MKEKLIILSLIILKVFSCFNESYSSTLNFNITNNISKTNPLSITYFIENQPKIRIKVNTSKSLYSLEDTILIEIEVKNLLKDTLKGLGRLLLYDIKFVEAKDTSKVYIHNPPVMKVMYPYETFLPNETARYERLVPLQLYFNDTIKSFVEGDYLVFVGTDNLSNLAGITQLKGNL